MDAAQSRFRDAFMTEEQLEASVAYLTQQFGKFLKRRERVLICHPDAYGSIGWAIGQAVERCEAVPIYLGSDMRWMTILRTAFSSRCNTIVTEPLVLLGLSKLTKAMGVPLFLRNAVLSGYLCMPWMREGMQQGLDCRTYGLFDPAGVAAGFIVPEETTLWLRKDLFDAFTRDEAGNILPDGEYGDVVVRSAADPSAAFFMSYRGIVRHVPCEGERDNIGLSNMTVGRNVELEIARLSGHLLRWSSILDCRVTRSDYGLELEIVTFPGEKLPKLPSCAKQVVRPWDPETEIPFSILFPENAGKND